MKTWKDLRGRFGLLLVVSSVAMLLVYHLWSPDATLSAQPSAFSAQPSFSVRTITPLNGTPHLLVSSFADQRVKPYGVRIIGIFRLDAVKPLRCVFLCTDGDRQLLREAGGDTALVLPHSDHFGFAYGTTDILCGVPRGCRATHVTLTPEGQPLDKEAAFLPIRNRKSVGDGDGGGGGAEPGLNLTVCISNLFGAYNNVLQFTQSLEMYR
ncbi:hypothetical protein NHX12_000236 [Muraenolepis orangiensis]|uniref:Uncharacterized protein n=1 Tax=Muraenolepis orangiensis TaxID=630683 RepID=A0A9Q0I2E0_9TELE|nr:hypothetical protein NHX12_000236 [Muraenolepis orangiensis]